MLTMIVAGVNSCKKCSMLNSPVSGSTGHTLSVAPVRLQSLSHAPIFAS